MMTLDNCCIACTRFNYIWVNCTLSKEIYLTNLLSFVFEYSNKFFANNLSLCFWVRNTSKLI